MEERKSTLVWLVLIVLVLSACLCLAVGCAGTVFYFRSREAAASLDWEAVQCGDILLSGCQLHGWEIAHG